MRGYEKNTVDLYHEELSKQREKNEKKVQKFKQSEEKKRKKELKRLEKFEDREFARKNKLSRESRYNLPKNDIISKYILITYKISIATMLFITITYFIYSLIRKKISVFNSVLFTFMMFGFILSVTIQKKKEKRISFIITSILCILWMLLHL